VRGFAQLTCKLTHAFSRAQICHEFERFSTYMPNVKVANFFGGFPIKQQIEQLKTNPPHAVVGTPGRIKQVLASADAPLHPCARSS
jgi:ATP-dependent RNA helicase UAP56/SUB2